MPLQKPIVLVLRGVIRNSHGQYLLMQRSRKNCVHWPGYWEFPGGKVGPREGHREAFIREMKEETGMDMVPGKLVAEFDWEREHDTVLYRIFLAASVSGQFQMSDEHDDFGWFTKEEIQKLQVSPPLLDVIAGL